MNLDVETVMNADASSLDLGDLAGSSSLDASFENGTTGAGSTNSNTVTINNAVNVDVTNTANVGNTLSATVNTGENTTSQNTTVGDVSTGDVSIDFSFTNILN